MEDRLPEGSWTTLDVYLTGQVQDHLSVCVHLLCEYVCVCNSDAIRVGGSRLSTGHGPIAEVEVGRDFVRLGLVSETPHNDSGREPLCRTHQCP